VTSVDQQQAISLDQYGDLLEDYLEQGQTDGFPAIPSYPEGVDAMVIVSQRNSHRGHWHICLSVRAANRARRGRTSADGRPHCPALNSRHNVMGEGFRPNAAIGRAIRLGLINLGGSPWEALHMTFGYQAQDSTIRALGVHSSLVVNHEASTPQELLRDARRGGPTNRNGGGGAAILYFGGRHRDVVRSACWSHQNVQDHVAVHLGRAIADVRSRGCSGGRLRPDQSETEFLGRIANPGNVVVLAAGGPGSCTLVNRGDASGHGVQLIGS
jgi:hypothetical protein